MTRPAYVYDLAALAAHVQAIRSALPDRIELLYAVKANPDPDLLRTLAPLVDGFEAASAGELRHLAAVLPGRPPAAFGGPGKTEADLSAGLAARVGRFHVESPTELRRLDRLARSAGTAAEVLLRVNLPVAVAGASLVMGGGPSPFGMSPADAVACARQTLPGVRIHGVHAHLASGLAAPVAAEVARQIVDWAVTELGAAEVNVGGGMTVDYADPDARFDWAGYGAALGGVLDAYPEVVLRVEPGRALTAYCGSYVTEVIDVKRSHGEWFVVVAGGTHHLRTPAAKGHAQPFTVHPRGRADPALPATDGVSLSATDGVSLSATDGGSLPATDGGPVTVVGQLCTPKDVLSRADRPGRIAVGDVLVFAMAGAYAWNISHHDFLMHDPPEFLTGDPRMVAARRARAQRPVDLPAAGLPAPRSAGDSPVRQ
ncbi:type III PLP-dependent enzyme [Micromonospora polyrhachis]|uniref:Diaminopimelate decarboxylase n=1 Tax=Micromonospora polyrhachis TaxID=1282883 RepID=A0A7W7SLD2_9ACTN|nr:alanine racemase [Micromonospora polyrhachis]MBB4956923.1 diaminopimelate decarboxylase [Micromonospora polyrhachis]